MRSNHGVEAIVSS